MKQVEKHGQGERNVKKGHYRMRFDIFLLASCQTTDVEKSNIGGGIGAALGGTLGALVGKSTGQKIALGVAGAAIGGLIGYQIGKYVDEQDRAAIENKAAESLETAKDGEAITWKNPKSGVEAEITPSETRTVKKTVSIPRDKDVVPPPSLKLIGDTYVATNRSNIRPAPNTSNKPVGSIAAGEKVDVVGKVEGANWYMVARGGKSIGYVSTSLLKLAPKSEQQPKLRSAEAYDLDSFKKDDQVAVDEVQTTTECRKLNYIIAVQAKDASENNSFEACKAPDGAWELDKVA